MPRLVETGRLTSSRGETPTLPNQRSGRAACRCRLASGEEDPSCRATCAVSCITTLLGACICGVTANPCGVLLPAEIRLGRRFSRLRESRTHKCILLWRNHLSESPERARRRPCRLGWAITRGLLWIRSCQDKIQHGRYPKLEASATQRSTKGGHPAVSERKPSAANRTRGAFF